jgi:uncharacterized membrane protein
MILLFCVAITLLRMPVPVQAAEVQVKALLFFNPSCPNCKKVLNEVLPPLARQYGSRLQVLPVDITTTEGKTILESAITAYSIPSNQQFVPLMLVGDTLLVGAEAIANQFPGMVEKNLASGGTNWPAIPGLAEYLKTQGLIVSAETDSRTSMEIFLADQPANTLAVLVLVMLVVSLVWSIVMAFSHEPQFMKTLPGWVFPALLVIGTIIASYLSYTELTRSEVVCGVVGKCNAVQNSPYSKILGVIPIGWFGLAGYIAIGSAWLVQRFLSGIPQAIASIAMFGFGIFGVSFSIYLTFLEPFVIGATCMWCLGSAFILALLLPQTSAGIRATIENYNIRAARTVNPS